MSKIDHSCPDVQHTSSAVPPSAPQSEPRAPGGLPASAGAPAAAREERVREARAHIGNAKSSCNDLLILLAQDGTQADCRRSMRRALVHLHHACEELLLPAAADIIDQGVA